MHKHDPEVTYKAVEALEHMFFGSSAGHPYMAEYRQLVHDEGIIRNRRKEFEDKYREEFLVFINTYSNP